MRFPLLFVFIFNLHAASHAQFDTLINKAGDTILTQKVNTLKIHQQHFSKWSECMSLTPGYGAYIDTFRTETGIQLVRHCPECWLKGVNRKGRTKWTIDLKELGSCRPTIRANPIVKGIEYDVLMMAGKNDYWLNSRKGKLRPFERNKNE